MKNARTRMFKTLGLLAVAMLAGKSLLTWIEPAHSPGANLNDRALGLMIRYNVETHVPQGNLQWERIRVLALYRPNPVGGLPAPADVRLPHHFVINDHGRVDAGERWREQREWDEFPKTICLAVATRPGGRRFNDVQLSTLRELLRTLQLTYGAAIDMTSFEAGEIQGFVPMGLGDHHAGRDDAHAGGNVVD